jgi:hypothetical protein
MGSPVNAWSPDASWETRRVKAAAALLSIVLTGGGLGLFLLDAFVPLKDKVVEPYQPKKPVEPFVVRVRLQQHDGSRTALVQPPALPSNLKPIILPPTIAPSTPDSEKAPVFTVVVADPRSTMSDTALGGPQVAASGAAPAAPLVGSGKAHMPGGSKGADAEGGATPGPGAAAPAEPDDLRTRAQIDGVFSIQRSRFADAAQGAPTPDAVIRCELDIQPAGKAVVRCTPDRVGVDPVAREFERLIRTLDFGKARRSQRFDKDIPISSIR